MRILIVLLACLLVACETTPTYQSPPPSLSDADRALQARRSLCQSVAAAAMSGGMRLGEAMAAAGRAINECMAGADVTPSYRPRSNPTPSREQLSCTQNGWLLECNRGRRQLSCTRNGGLIECSDGSFCQINGNVITCN